MYMSKASSWFLFEGLWHLIHLFYYLQASELPYTFTVQAFISKCFHLVVISFTLTIPILKRKKENDCKVQKYFPCLKYKVGSYSFRIKEFSLLEIQPVCHYNTNTESTNPRNEKAAWKVTTYKAMTHNSCHSRKIQNPSVIGCFLFPAISFLPSSLPPFFPSFLLSPEDNFFS